MAEKHKSQHSESSNSPECRILYPWFYALRTKRANGAPLTKPRRDATLAFPKLSTDATKCANYAYLARHCMDAAAKAWPGSGGWPQGGHWPIQDGDSEIKAPAVKPGQAPMTAEQYAAYIAGMAWRRGHWLVEVTNYLDPGPKIAVMQNGQAIELPAQTVNGKEMFKSGDYGIVHMHSYTFENEKFGANFGFEGVLFTREGERVGKAFGPRSAASMFGTVAKFAPTLPTTAPAPHQPQPGYPAAGFAGNGPNVMGPPAAPVAPAAPTYAAPPMPPGAPQVAAPPLAPVAPLAPPAPVAPAAGGLPPFPGAR